MFQFQNSYSELPDRFFARVEPMPAPGAEVIAVNDQLTADLGMEAAWLKTGAGLSVISGESRAAGSVPIAMAYAGHQFGQFVPQLGDGRAILLGEVATKDGGRFDVQLKGSGKTPFSRGGDGNAALGPVLREYLVSEAMAALKVPTTRALAALSTGEQVYRDGPVPGGRVVRVAASHVRVGTFQFFAARGDVEALQALSDYVIARHYPQAAQAERPALALLKAVVRKQADLIAHWQSLGFIHGVMNTDNMSIAGETIDYGPCAFMDAFDPAQVFSSIDHAGRYAYQNQPAVAQWNLAMLAQAVLPLMDGDEDEAVRLAQAAVDGFVPRFVAAYRQRFGAKLGLAEVTEADDELIGGFLSLMARGSADFTLSFRLLAEQIEAKNPAFVDLFSGGDGVVDWLKSWRERLTQEGRGMADVAGGMAAVNPIYIPRNHQVEAAIVAGYDGDFAPFHALNEVLAHPFEVQEGCEDFALPPRPEEIVHQTFCGT